MQIRTNAYTISSLVKEISGLSLSQVSNVDSLVKSISPVAGSSSVKVAVLNSYLNGNLNAIINGKGNFSNLGKTAKTRVLTALKNRKNS